MSKIKAWPFLSLLAIPLFALASCNDGPNQGVVKPTEEEQEKPQECNHFWNEIAKDDATCLENGKLYYVCVHCGVTNEEEILALGHTYSNWNVVTEATEDHEGLKQKECYNCHDVVSESIPQLDHVHHYNASVVEPTCVSNGYTVHECACGDVYTDNEKLAYGHLEVIDAAVEATCITNGLTEGSHCYTCNAVLVEQKVIEASHTVVIDAAVEPSCEVEGLTEGSHCSTCNEVFVTQESVAAIGHNYIEGVCGNCDGEYYTQDLRFYVGYDYVCSFNL